MPHSLPPLDGVFANEDLIKLNKSGPHFRTESPPVTNTLWRWGLTGTRGRKLETILIGGVRYTSLEAIRRFEQFDPATKSEAYESPSESAKRASDELDSAGW
jgi:hypothetical protein